MTRPLRLEFAGALYHVTSRGDHREPIFLGDEDRLDWLEVLGTVCARFNWIVYTYCQMTNHYHLLIETVEGNLSKGMMQLNGTYTQRFNFRHKLTGHLFQGRFKAILVQKESYLFELTRYVASNPLRANIVESLDQWRWSSYPYFTENIIPPDWLDTGWLLNQFGTERGAAVEAYQQFVLSGRDLPNPMKKMRYQLLLGDDNFIAEHRKFMNSETLLEISKAHRKSQALTLEEYQSRFPEKSEAMAQAYKSGAYTMTEIGQHFKVHYMTVSRAVRKHENVGM
jgi:putative transposase